MPRQGPPADPEAPSEELQRQGLLIRIIEDVLSAVGQVIHVVAVDEHHRALRGRAGSPGGDDERAGHAGRERRAVVVSHEVEREVDAAGNAGRGVQPPLAGEQDVAQDLDAAIPFQGRDEVVMGGGGAPGEDSGLRERQGAGAHGGDAAAVVPVPADPLEQGA